ncbi:DUF5107 domain-containing protein [Maribellus comscasis]|uniref:DUF5107 domain-containing protein n=1 Tax=Maribellus comscasis TaxID=2681766 RepID=A0A6I6JZP4_9BACT|nr:DUF5107 domain-containing protein [Maribellus comscasis]QGY46648.1 DUF5107 domain-containing protein [Maribellus comscasis]
MNRSEIRRIISVGFILFYTILAHPLFAQVKLSEELWTLPTYPVLAPEKAPIFFTHENYQGASRYVYPYALNDVISNEKQEHDWKALILENEYIKLCVTPEIGGKLYYATDKTTDYNFVYKNNEVKPGNLGMTGAWVSGGIEWCVLHHHRASTFLPVDYSTAENKDGSKTIFIGETEPRHGMHWTIGITAFPGKSYFEADVAIYNPTPFTNTFLFWANVAAHTNENYQVIFPPSVQLATFHSKNDFTHWPISTEVYRGQDFTNGVDVSWWKNVKESASFFAHDLKEDFMGGYDHGTNTGTVHIGDHNIVKGAKLWEWGSGPRGQATEGRLTETSGPYVEIMVGAYSDNQPDYSWIKPFETKRWKQYWYPVKDIEGFKNANLNAAVNLEQRDENNVFLGYHATQEFENTRVILRNGDNIVFQKDIQISPETAFTETIELGGSFEMTNLYTELKNLETDEVLISYQPKEIKRPDLPPVVEPPAAPEGIETIEEVYLAGKRIEQFYNPRYNALDYYIEALQRDSNDIRTNTAVGNYYLKNGDFETARKYLATAIRRLTADYTRPSNCEALYLQGLTLKALGLFDEAVDTLYRATWDYAYHSAAYFELAQISGLRGDFKKALQQINESLSSNTKNYRAVALKSAIQRNLGDFAGAAETLYLIPENDPLNFRLANEVYLIEKAARNNPSAENELAELTKKMRGFDQNYLELAVGYIDDGMLQEAEDVLQRIKTDNPIIHYYRGYIQARLGNTDAAKIHFAQAESLPEDYCFPYRFQTIPVLTSALITNPDDGKAWYYLGNILYDKQPEKAVEYWKKAVEAAPGLAVASRNLGWAYYRYFKDYEQAILWYEKAMALNPVDAIYYSELDNLYELNNSAINKRLALFAGKNDVVKNRDDAFVRQITVLTLAGQPEKSVQYLQDKKFSYREGNSRVREVIIDAQLSLGLTYFAEEEHEKALEHFLLAQIPDEEAGSARSGNRDIQVNYFIGVAYKALKDEQKADEYFVLATEGEGRTSVMSYYKGLSFLELKKKKEAEEIFDVLVENGNQRLNPKEGQGNDFFAIFGEREADKTRQSMAYTLRGLGYKGLGKNKQAKEDLSKAVELSVGNLWAQTELKEL